MKVDNLIVLEKKSVFGLKGNEEFTYYDQKTEMNISDFWRWHYSDVYDLQDKIAEYVVAKALGCSEPYNVGTWTLFDILYRGYRIEVKETSYYHSWQTDEETKSRQRIFGITKAYSEYQNNKSIFERQNDIYVFCLNTGDTKNDSNPLKLENWEFYIIPTAIIDKECGNGKTISLSKVRKLAEKLQYDEIKKRIDEIIDSFRVNK